MFLFYLRKHLGASEASCTERQCMEALAATSEHLTDNPVKAEHLTPYAGPQCFAHLNPEGSCFRLNANFRRCSEKPVDHGDRPVLNALHPTDGSSVVRAESGAF